MKEVCDIEICTGCNLCASVCPKSCIQFVKEYNGHVYPKINEMICIDCNKCVKTCIAKQIHIPKNEAKYGCYAAWHKDVKEQYESASGGLATTISKYILKQGGKVYGCAWSDNLEAVHIGIESEKDIERLRKSKYSLSKISKEIFEDIRFEVHTGRLCLFIGVPCQCDAVRKFIGTDYNNLIFIDLLCRGGASPLILSHHVKYLCQKYKLVDINNVTFRGGDYDCRLALRHNNQVRYYGNQFEDEYFLGFMSHVIYRTSCFSCQYASKNRIGDITLADFWGLDNDIVEKFNFLRNGVNLLLVNTEKGRIIFDAIRLEVNLLERNIGEAIAGNETLKCPTQVPEMYETFWQNMRKHSFEDAIHITFKKEYNRIKVNKIKHLIIAPLSLIKHKIKKYIIKK